jgi:hypothetical protein
MLKILALLVFNIVFLLAKDFPLERSINIKIINNTTTILEFPFIIKDKTLEKFRKVVDESKEKSVNKVEVPVIKTQIKEIDGKKVVVSKKDEDRTIKNNSNPMIVNVSTNGNIVELKPYVEGITKIILWGYEHYPIMVNVEVVDNENIPEKNDYFRFLDYEAPKDEVVKFEAQKHETIIRKLIKSGYLNEVPDGYKKTVMNEVEDNEKYKMILNQVYVGNKYGLKIYDFVNKSESDLVIKNNMFYKQGVIFAVSIEKLPHNKEVILKPNELTRIFMVFKNKES